MAEEWGRVTIGELLDFKNGLNKEKSAFGSGTPIVNYMDVYKNPGLHRDDIKGRVQLTTEEIKRFLVKEGDVFFTRTSETPEEVGLPGVLLDHIDDCTFSGFLLRGRPISELLIKEYAQYCFLNSDIRKQIISNCTYTTRALTNGKVLSKISFLLPPKSEQSKIATALGDIDDAIESLQNLLRKKKNIKIGTMQELITGKRRLEGFKDEWRNDLWGNVLSGFSAGATPYRGEPEYYKGDIKWVSSGELNYTTIYDTIEHISLQALYDTNLKIHQPGTFLMAITGLEAAGTRGSCAILGTEAATNQSCLAITGTKKMNIGFLYYYYQLYGDALAFQFAQGTKQQSYTAKIVKKLPIYYPIDISEQAEIVAVLEDMEAEIKLLEDKLKKYIDLKQGMMQELLSGRIRFA